MNKECFTIYPILETERLILRKFKETDVFELFNILSDPEVAQYEYFYPTKTIDEASEFIKRFHEEYEDQSEMTWAIQLKENQKVIGLCNIGDFDEYARRAEIGYDIVKSEWNKGYASEAVKAMVTLGIEKMNLNRIEAFISTDNARSVRVLEKVGFKLEGVVRERDYIKGKLEDSIIMAILKREFFQ